MTSTDGVTYNRRVSDYCPGCNKTWEDCKCVCWDDIEESEQEEATDTTDETEPFLPDDAA